MNLPQPLLPTLRQRLLRTVLLPLAVTWVAGTVVSFAVAQYFSQRAFDRSLLDDAYLLATHVHPARRPPAAGALAARGEHGACSTRRDHVLQRARLRRRGAGGPARA
jgi:hypothetical protein